jgi:hypothetical protein
MKYCTENAIVTCKPIVQNDCDYTITSFQIKKCTFDLESQKLNIDPYQSFCVICPGLYFIELEDSVSEGDLILVTGNYIENNAFDDEVNDFIIADSVQIIKKS